MKKIIPILLLFAVIISCKQEEYMPDPYGEKVSYEETDKKSLDALLTDSKSSLFKLALDGSTVHTLLSTKWKHIPLTFLVPSDAAFTEAGFTPEKLKNMNTTDLDSIILYHVLSEKVDTANVRSTYGNIRIKSILENKNLKLGGRYSSQAYTYSHYFSITDNKVLINGRIVGDYKISQAAEGDVIFIDSFLKKPEKTLWQTMKEDSRLSMFMEIVEANDELYGQSFYYDEEPWGTYAMEEAVMRPQLDVTVDEYNPSNVFISGSTSIFAPTNEAFIKAGYTTATEFIQLNDAHWKYRGEFLTFAGGAPYNYRTFHKTDSVLTYHHGWAQRYYPTDGGGGGFSTVFFSNDLKDEYLGNYILQLETGSPNSQPRMTCPYTFSYENGKKKMRLKNAKQGTEAATIVEQDILTLNGPLYIVDRLFIPNHF